MPSRSTTLFLAAIAAGTAPLPAAEPVHIYLVPANGPAKFAAEEISAALVARGEGVVLEASGTGRSLGVGRNILLASVSVTKAGEPLHNLSVNGVVLREPQNDGFFLTRTDSAVDSMITVNGGGAGGTLYGGLELAEQIRLRGFAGVEPLNRDPHFSLRGVKFNVPLDVRTPSYTDMSDSAQANIAEVWSFDFWREFLDRLARDRYNYVALWNLHPFPSLVRVPEYPDVALADVQRSTIRFEENYPLSGANLVTPAMLEQVEVVSRMSIDEKIEFWRRVMQYGRDRNIDFYVVTWNIFTNGTGGKYGITDAIDNPVTIDYFRKSVAQLFRTYPLLRGIGLTTGENMGDASFEAKENWALATYGEGVLDVLREQPGRKPHPGTDSRSIPEEVAAVLAGKEMMGTSPATVAARLHEHASAALARIDAIHAGTNNELRDTLADIRAMAHLGHYYGHKIAGALALEFFRKTGNAVHQRQAVDELTRAADSWAQYTEIAASLYKNPLWTNRVGHVDWAELSAEVSRDIAIARTTGTPTDP